MKKYLIISTIVTFFLNNSGAFGQNANIIPMDSAYKRVYPISVILPDQAPKIDGKLDDYVWQHVGQWTQDFVQAQPFERYPTDYTTRAKIFRDDKYIYVGIYCYDPHPENIIGFIGLRDDNSVGDQVCIAFDTYHDFRAAPELYVNAGGNQTDQTITDKRVANKSWNAVWEVKTNISLADSCWTAEYKIPFSQIRYNQKNDEGIWGLHIRRVIPFIGETQNWSLIPTRNNGHVFSFGEMHGMYDLPKPRGIEFLPYVLGKNVNEPAIPNSPYQQGTEWQGNVGFDAKIAIRDFTLDATINPDFGQVQLDPSEMNLTAYETFFDEMRPFFLEGKHIFDYGRLSGGDMMFYSRRIGAAPPFRPAGIDNVNSFAETASNVPIIGSLKLTGTSRSGLTIGIIESVTQRSSLLTMRNNEEAREVVAPLSNYTVARIQQNLNNGNTLIGGMFTSVNRILEEQHLKDALVKDAFVGGIDYVQYFNNRLYLIDAKAMISSLNGSEKAIWTIQENSVHYFQRVSSQDYLQVDPTLTSLTGTGGYVRVGRVGNSVWTVNETFNWASPKFDFNDVGYMREADYLNNVTEIAYRQTTAWAGLRNSTFTLTQTNRWDFGGLATGNDIMLGWNASSMKQTTWNIRGTYVLNSIDTRMLRGGPNVRFNPYFQTNLTFNTDKAKWVYFTIGHTGDFRDELQNISLSGMLTFRAGNHLLFSGQMNFIKGHNTIQYITRTMSLNEDGGSSVPGYIVGDIDQTTYGITLKAQVNITPDLSIQFYGAPYTSVGKYDKFKIAENPQSHNQSERFYTFSESETSFENNNYTLGKSGQESYRFRNPDFSLNEFRSNLVLRWEYMRGSTIYFVWQHVMSDRSTDYIKNWGTNLDRMFGLPITNTFMLKINYWFAL